MRLFKLVLSVLLLLSLAGCGSKIELDKLTFVFGLYIDAGEEPGTVELTISAPLPNRLLSSTQPNPGDGKSYSMVSKTASTVADAFALIQRDLPRRLEISHIKVVVLGKEYARQGIDESLEWFKRQPEFPLGTYIMTASGKAKAAAQLSALFEQTPDQVLMNFSKENLLFATTVRDCALAEASNMGYAMNLLSLKHRTDPLEPGKSMHWAGLQGLALFHKAKLSGTLNIYESRAFAWAAGHLAGSFYLPEYSVTWDDNGQGSASALFLSNKASLHTRFTEDGPVFYLKLKGSASIINYHDSLGRGAENLSPFIVQKLQKAVVKEVSQAVRATQEAGADVLQFGMQVEWNNPGEWKRLKERWEDYYSHDAQIKVSADIKIQDIGSVK
ncbi:hypothetical protein D3C73_652450 [compost metagenome]